MTEHVFYRQKKAIKAGQIERFEINYSPYIDTPSIVPNLWVKVRNMEPIAMRAAFIVGPFVLYVDCRSDEYKANEKCFITANQPSFESQLQPSKSFYSELSCNTLKPTYKWTVDVISQMIFSSSMEINFEILIGTSKETLHNDTITCEPSPSLIVHNLDTFDLWNLPIPIPNKPIHLVILTHGLHSNVSADMLYLKESIDNSSNNENIVVKGYFGNICKTERGIKYLGSRVAEYIVNLVKNEDMFVNKVNKISFIGHSLGGLVQTFAIAYLQNNFPWFFDQIAPINFITIASPLLGASNENPIYINLALLAGIAGKTGHDLSLRHNEYLGKPLLLLLPTGPTHRVLKKFVRRTIYANVANDGVVPLRTSALLFLDHQGLETILGQKGLNSHHLQDSSVDKIPDDEHVDTGDAPGSMLPQAVQMMLSKFLPQKQQAVNNTSDDADQNGETKPILKQIRGLHNSSLIETAQSLVLPPFPPMSFITNPEEREESIIYEKVYHEEDLPSSNENYPTLKPTNNEESPSSEAKETETLRQRLMSTIDVEEFEKIEEEIAREYHKAMSWKKVLVKLKPDAHNNIIVRRRFANAYGWPVIQHLIDDHFPEPKVKTGFLSNLGIGIFNNNDSLEDVGLDRILSQDIIRKENEVIDANSDNYRNDHQWINNKEKGSLFDVGPAGMLADVSEMVANIRGQWYNTNTDNINDIQPSSSGSYVSEFNMSGTTCDFM